MPRGVWQCVKLKTVSRGVWLYQTVSQTRLSRMHPQKVQLVHNHEYFHQTKGILPAVVLAPTRIYYLVYTASDQEESEKSTKLGQTHWYSWGRTRGQRVGLPQGHLAVCRLCGSRWELRGWEDCTTSHHARDRMLTWPTQRKQSPDTLGVKYLSVHGYSFPSSLLYLGTAPVR